MTTQPAEATTKAIEAKHTPGPWRWYADAFGNVDLRTPNRGMLLVMDAKRYGVGGTMPRFADRSDSLGGTMMYAKQLTENWPAKGGFVAIDNPDARLIAAAPDLLEELIAAQAALAMVYAGRTEWRGHVATLETVSSAMKSARAAISKATGGVA